MERRSMTYVVAAYAVVVGSLFVYGFRVQRQRRKLMHGDDGERGI
jgi:hypothetical protein